MPCFDQAGDRIAFRQMTIATHTLTDGLNNFIFEVSDETCLIKFVNCFGAITETMQFTVEEGRKQWKLALACGNKRGYTNPRRPEPSAFAVEMGEVPLYVD
jgi:hypothetical protein